MAMAEPVAAAAVGETAAAGSVEGGALRTPRPGKSAMAVDGANRPAKPKPPARQRPAAPASAPAPQQDTGPSEQAAEDGPEKRSPRRSLPNPGGAVREGSWVVLGFLGWVWVALPFIKKGPSGVRDVLAAKFINRTPGGK